MSTQSQQPQPGAQPTLVFVPGAWHRASCYDKIIKILREEHHLKCVAVTLPSTTGDPEATFKDDLDAARKVIREEVDAGRDVVVLAHSYGGLVGGSAVRGFTRRKEEGGDEESLERETQAPKGFVIGFVLIASGFTLTGMAFMDPFFGYPPPAWRVNKETGFADLVTSPDGAGPKELFYHDLPEEEAEYYTQQLMPQSLKALFEGGEYAYAGWRDVGDCWYLGTLLDRGLPVLAQRLSVGMARSMGCGVVHREFESGHSVFLSMPREVVSTIVEAVEAFVGKERENGNAGGVVGEGGSGSAGGNDEVVKTGKVVVPKVGLWEPRTWLKFGLPLAFGHVLGRSYLGFCWVRSWFR